MLRRRTRRTVPAEPAEVRARWEELRRTAPELAEGIELQRAVQRLQREADLHPLPPPFTAEQARERLAAGVPLLSGTAPFLDVDAAIALFAQLARDAVRGAQSYAPCLEDPPWDRAVCPVCGAAPLLGELRGGESRRVLRCGRCGTAWDFQRLRCVFCDTRDHRKLSALHLEGQSDFLRIDACDNCGGYIKTMARLDAIPYELLLAEDLATAHLDLLALERGYRRPLVVGP
jgi:formate dehydrogenase maturation protein FdhE